MRPYLLFAVLVLAGAASLCVGVAAVFGVGWSLMAGGVLLMAAGLLIQPPVSEKRP